MATFDQFSRNFSKNIRQAIDQAINRATLNETGDFLSQQIRIRTRAGRGIAEPEGRPQRLEPLSTQYIGQRRRFRANGDLSSQTSPARSNLTLTGQMLDSIDYTVDTRRKLITMSFSNQDAIDKALYVTPNRPFFNASRGDVIEVTRRWNYKIARELANITFNM